jgi:hypothetical protein
METETFVVNKSAFEFGRDLLDWLRTRNDVIVPEFVTGLTITCSMDDVPRITFDTIVMPMTDEMVTVVDLHQDVVHEA